MERTDEPALDIFRSRGPEPPGPGLFGGMGTGIGEDEGGPIERTDALSPALDG
jgi:hypothetical protein